MKPSEFAESLASRVLTWCITEPRRGDVQRAELAAIIQDHMDTRDETALLLAGANVTCNKIAELVGQNRSHRDLVEAVEAKLQELQQ